MQNVPILLICTSHRIHSLYILFSWSLCDGTTVFSYSVQLFNRFKEKGTYQLNGLYESVTYESATVVHIIVLYSSSVGDVKLSL